MWTDFCAGIINEMEQYREEMSKIMQETQKLVSSQQFTVGADSQPGLLLLRNQKAERVGAEAGRSL